MMGLSGYPSLGYGSKQAHVQWTVLIHIVAYQATVQAYFMASVWTIKFQDRQSGEVPSQHFSAACLVMTVPSVSFSRAS